MSDCVCLPTCPFFHDKMSSMPTMGEMYKQNYCRGDSSRCARFLVFANLGAGKAPMDLYPNDMERAKKFVAEFQAPSTI